MDGRLVVITGGTSGIGRVAAVELAGRTARFVLIARDQVRVAGPWRGVNVRLRAAACKWPLLALSGTWPPAALRAAVHQQAVPSCVRGAGVVDFDSKFSHRCDREPLDGTLLRHIR
jgi:NAD(P)-dependent dehydrogenase (short-subunit alcohol dehydrogenase family)